jgi:hypothetical protein
MGGCQGLRSNPKGLALMPESPYVVDCERVEGSKESRGADAGRVRRGQQASPGRPERAAAETPAGWRSHHTNRSVQRSAKPQGGRGENAASDEYALVLVTSGGFVVLSVLPASVRDTRVFIPQARKPALIVVQKAYSTHELSDTGILSKLRDGSLRSAIVEDHPYQRHNFSL